MKKLITIFLVLFVVFTTVIGTAMYFQLRPEVKDAIDGKKEEENFGLPPTPGMQGSGKKG